MQRTDVQFIHSTNECKMLQAGQENTPHHGKIVKGEGFILTLYNIAQLYRGLYPHILILFYI